METEAVNRNHGLAVKVSCFSGFLLLFFAAGCIGSAILLRHNENAAKARWSEAAARVRTCRVWSYDAKRKLSSAAGSSFALVCEINYQFAGRTYYSSLHSDFTRSLQTRLQLEDWAARNGQESVLPVRIDPVSPDRFEVRGTAPFRQPRNPDNYLYAALAFGMTGISLVSIGRKLLRAGW